MYSSKPLPRAQMAPNFWRFFTIATSTYFNPLQSKTWSLDLRLGLDCYNIWHCHGSEQGTNPGFSLASANRCHNHNIYKQWLYYLNWNLSLTNQQNCADNYLKNCRNCAIHKIQFIFKFPSYQTFKLTVMLRVYSISNLCLYLVNTRIRL